MPIPIPQPTEENQAIVTFFFKATTYILTFVSGIVTTTVVITRKLTNFENEMAAMKRYQETCPGRQYHNETLIDIKNKLNFIIDTGLPRVYDKIDEKVETVLQRELARHNEGSKREAGNEHS